MSLFGKNPWPGVARQHCVAGTRTLVTMDRTGDAQPACLSGVGSGSACCSRLDMMLASCAVSRSPRGYGKGVMLATYSQRTGHFDSLAVNLLAGIVLIATSRFIRRARIRTVSTEMLTL